jgi:hypothetical protein
MTPKEFVEKIKEELSDNSQDAEGAHWHTDVLMEDLLISLGYAEGINLIKESERWYA